VGRAWVGLYQGLEPGSAFGGQGAGRRRSKRRKVLVEGMKRKVAFWRLEDSRTLSEGGWGVPVLLEKSWRRVGVLGAKRNSSDFV